MGLTPGTRVGPYEVTGALGAGGMGEVYRARDTKLNRDVALKILPEAFATDADRLARFSREAQTLAALNHPNIAQIYGLEESSGARALAMELVEGEDLSAIVARGPVPFADALPIANHIVSALEAAHELGIIHRDLKPANIRLTAGGSVKVLDFGLAKAVTTPDTDSNTMTSPAMTQQGFIIGTAGYMSPEQAKGKPVDKRADIWAFGVVFFEMLTGRSLYRGETVSETLAAVIKDTPDLGALPQDTPERVRTLIARCLDRDPKRRLRDIGEARILLDTPEAADRSTGGSPVAPARARLGLSAASLVGALAIGAAIAWPLKAVPASPIRHFEIRTPDHLRAIEAVISPDGKAVAFASAEKAWIQRLDQGTAQEIPGAASTRILFWSPDSAFLGYQVRGHLWKVAIADAAPIDLGPVPRDFSAAGGAAWLSDDRIWYTTGGSGLLEVSAQGGQSRTVLDVTASTELDFHDVSPLPDARGVLFIPHPVTGLRGAIDCFDGRERHRVLTLNDAVTYTAWSPSGHILFRLTSGVWAVRFSLSSLKASGEPFLVAADATRPSVSADGTLVVVPEGASTDQQLTWSDRNGRTLSPLGRSGIPVRYPRLSPDGKQVVATIAGANIDLYIFDVESGADRRLTFENDDDMFPVWSRDGRVIVYQCGRAVCARRADGTGGRVVLVPEAAFAPAVSPDDKYLLFSRDQPATGTDLFMVALGPDGFSAPPIETPRPLVVARGRQINVDISPDGKYLAYGSSETGGPEIYITSFPSAEGKWQVSRSGGGEPRWSRGGDKVFFQTSDKIFEAAINYTLAPAPGAPVLFVSGPALGARISPNWFERSLDGARLLFPRSPTGAGDAGAVRLIEQWAKEHRGK